MGNSLASVNQLVGVVLAAGAGTRLRPLTDIRPKALCPVDGVALIDLALERLVRVTPEVVVNAHHGAGEIASYVDGRARLSLEEQALGTAGALGNLKEWIDGRDVVVHNVDSWHDADLDAFVQTWDRSRARLLTVERGSPSDFGTRQYAGVALLRWRDIVPLAAERSGLYEVDWRHRRPGVDIELVDHAGRFFDCGTPGRYLAANLAASGGASVVGTGARVEGRISRSVIWPGARVWRAEALHGAIRATDQVTVLVR